MVTFQEFQNQARILLEEQAKAKGYNDTGIDGQNHLYELTSRLRGPHAHALGEIIYKAVRFNNKGDLTDLLKIVAWAFLIYRGVRTAEDQKTAMAQFGLPTKTSFRI